MLIFWCQYRRHQEWTCQVLLISCTSHAFSVKLRFSPTKNYLTHFIFNIFFTRCCIVTQVYSNPPRLLLQTSELNDGEGSKSEGQDRTGEGKEGRRDSWGEGDFYFLIFLFLSWHVCCLIIIISGVVIKVGQEVVISWLDCSRFLTVGRLYVLMISILLLSCPILGIFSFKFSILGRIFFLIYF